GFKIAMRDLSIRGAGNLLGAAQHGFIDSVGFDLYSQMLKEAIDARKLGKEIEAVKPFNPELGLIVDAYIPNKYIEDEQQKINMNAQQERVESLMETDKKIELLVTKERSQDIDGTKLVELANEYGRSVRLGTTNDQLKVTFSFNKKETKKERYELVSNFIKEM